MSNPDITTKPVVSGHGRVAEFLRQQLREGHLKVGDRLLPERELASRLDVSRPVVREALRSLEAMGVLEIRAGFGTVVRAFDMKIIGEFFGLAAATQADVLDDILELRIALERQAVWLACRHLRPADEAKLKAAFQRIEATLEDPIAGAKADYDFHTALMEASGSPSLLGLYGVVAELVMNAHARLREMMVKSEANHARVLRDHRAILDALLARDEEEADRALMTHYWRGPGPVEPHSQTKLDAAFLSPAPR